MYSSSFVVFIFLVKLNVHDGSCINCTGFKGNMLLYNVASFGGSSYCAKNYSCRHAHSIYLGIIRSKCMIF